MDPNLLFWKSHGQSFLSRVKIWFDLLDPTLLLSSDNEIRKAYSLLKNDEKQSDKHGHTAATVALSSVHADTGEVLPICFRPPALLPLSSTMVYVAYMPHNTVKSALFCHFLLQSYFTGFNYTNRNASSKQEKEMSLRQMLLHFGVISYTTCAGAVPQIIIHKLQLTNPLVKHFCRTVLSVPIAVFLAYYNLTVVRCEEYENGIQVFDSEGKVVGLSRVAGEKAVRETSLSRAALFGIATAGPNIILTLLQRIKFLQRRLLLLKVLRPYTVVLMLGLMVPVSFSLFPQLGKIKKQHLEKELKAAAMEGHLFYHRGL